MHPSGRALLVSLVCLVSLTAAWPGTSLGASGSGADPGWDQARIDPASATLPEATADPGVAWTGQALLIVGGTQPAPSMYSDEILRWEPGADQVEDTGARLPAGRTAPMTVWNGTHAFILGGDGCLGDQLDRVACRDILRYDPATGQVETMDPQLPEGRWGATGAWNGTHVLLAGGRGSQAILAYHPPTDTLETLDVELPQPVEGASAAWADDALWLYGGKTSTGQDSQAPIDTIYRVDPSAGTLVQADVGLPTPRNHTAALAGPGGVHVFGGGDEGQASDDILFHDTTNGTLEGLSATLPTPRSRIASAWTGQAGYLVGGQAACEDTGSGGCPTDEILRYRLVDVDEDDGEDDDGIAYDPWAKASIDQTQPGVVDADASESTDPDGTIESFTWDWGDESQASTGPTAEHTYPSSGTYQITLTVTDDDGRTDTLARQITVEDMPPTAAFERQGDGLSPTFDAGASTDPEGEITGYLWSWGDGTSDDHGQTVDHTFETEGTYQVSLTVTDDQGQTDTATKAIEITRGNLDPTARFGVHTDDLTAKASAYGAEDTDGEITAYDWTWGDGTTSTGRTTDHTYAQTGTYTITLTVTDDQGAKAMTERTIEVTTAQAPQPPAARFSVEETGRTVSVDAQTSDGGSAQIQRYTWSWGDGTATSQGMTSLHTYERTGSYLVELTVTDANGETDTATQRVDVSNLAPRARFEATAEGTTLTVDAAQARDPDGTITSYRWAWGDDSPVSQGASAQHTYQRPGVYTVTLAIEDQDGATDRVDRRIEVGDRAAGNDQGSGIASGAAGQGQAEDPNTLPAATSTPPSAATSGSAKSSDQATHQTPGAGLIGVLAGVALAAALLAHRPQGRRKD